MPDNRAKAAERMGTDRNPMGDALRDHLRKAGETRTTASGKTKSDTVVLRDWKKKDKAVGSVERVRRVEKDMATYAQNFLDAANSQNVFHPRLLHSGAVTRRPRSVGFSNDETGKQTKGNIFNVPDRMREGITPRPGFGFWKMDLASVEARLIAHLMSVILGDDHFASRYRKEAKYNMYVDIMGTCAGLTKPSKKHKLYVPYKHFTLGRLYGLGVKRAIIQLRDKFEIDYTEEEVHDIYSKMDRYFPVVKKTLYRMKDVLASQGYIEDDWGDRYYVPDDKPYKVVAFYGQGCAANVLKWWWCRLRDLMKDTKDLISITLYDEFDFEIWRDKGARSRACAYRDCLQELDLFTVPILAEMKGPCNNWKECG